jgi:type II secretory pathway pseudopilin PulG
MRGATPTMKVIDHNRIKTTNQAGLTLVEIILSIALLSIVMIAVFSGLNFAYNVLFSSKELSEQTYEIQSEYEEELTLVRQLPTNTGSNETIQFEWDTDDLSDFNSHGITTIKEGKGGGYLEESIYMFIPLYTEETSP